MKRIISLLPASTEILCALGAGDQLVGISHECDYPNYLTRCLPVVTRPRIDLDADGQSIDSEVRRLLKSDQPLYEVNFRLVDSLRPDVIAVQGICPVCAIGRPQIDRICRPMEQLPEIIEMTPKSLDDVLHDIQRLGEVSNCIEKLRDCVDLLRQRIMNIALHGAMHARSPKVLILEWLNPFFSAGHWNPQLIELAGGEALLAQTGAPSRQITADQIIESDPDIIVISCCGFSIQRTHYELAACSDFPWKKLRAVQDRKLYITDGRHYFNRPGPRLIDTAELLSDLLFGENQSSICSINPALFN